MARHAISSVPAPYRASHPPNHWVAHLDAPQLTKLVEAVPEGDGWAHEIKLDGYRMHGRLDRGQLKLLTRTGLDWTEKYPTAAWALGASSAQQAYIDGELCAVAESGVHGGQTRGNVEQRHRSGGPQQSQRLQWDDGEQDRLRHAGDKVQA